MFDPAEYMQLLLDALTAKFGRRLVYVGLQGSYMRGEATENSDIDPMVVIDALCISDLAVYRQIVSSLPEPEKSCGFICGRKDLANWNPLEICHLLHTTCDYYGSLTDFVPDYSLEDVRNFAKLSVNNLYHEITHRYIHGTEAQNATHIADSYKSVFFILQNVHYLETGNFVATKNQLLERLTGEDKEILATAMSLHCAQDLDFCHLFSLLHCWCTNIIQRLAR